MIGDPGQIPPVVTIDVRRWETSPRAPHEAAPEVVLADPSFADAIRRFAPACRRLPTRVGRVREAVLRLRLRRLRRAGRPRSRPARRPPARSARPMADRSCSRCRHPNTGHRSRSTTTSRPPPPSVVARSARLGSARSDSATWRSPARGRGHRRVEQPPSHERGARSGARRSGAGRLRVDTPERWQGLERPVMIAVHPLSGVTDPSAFDLETGRLCVMASRHQSALIVLTRDHVGDDARQLRSQRRAGSRSPRRRRPWPRCSPPILGGARRARTGSCRLT